MDIATEDVNILQVAQEKENTLELTSEGEQRPTSFSLPPTHLSLITSPPRPPRYRPIRPMPSSIALATSVPDYSATIPAGKMERQSSGQRNLNVAIRPDSSRVPEELKRFCVMFQLKRVKLGYTMREVGLATGKMYRKPITSPMMSKFEAVNLQTKTIRKMKLVLEQWLKDAEHSPDIANLDYTDKTDKTTLIVERYSPATVYVFEEAFKNNPTPDLYQLGAIGRRANLKEAARQEARLWFYNR